MNIGVTGLVTGDNPASGFGVLKCLRDAHERDFRLMGVAYGLLETCLYEEGLLDRAFLAPFPAHRPEEFLERIAEIRQRHGLDLLIPNFDMEIPALAEMSHRLKRLGVGTLLPEPEAVAHLSKEELPRWIEKQGLDLRIPKTIAVQEAFLGEFRNIAFPCVVKGTVRGAMVVYSLREMRLAVEGFLRKGPGPVLVQEYIPGEGYSVAVLADRESRVVGFMPVKKFLITKSGGTWMGITIEDKRLQAAAEEVVKELPWVGPMDMEFIRSETDENYYLIEINPRFPAWISFSALVGANLPLMLVDIVSGAQPLPCTPAPGEVFVRQAIDIVTGIDRFGTFSLAGELEYD